MKNLAWLAAAALAVLHTGPASAQSFQEASRTWKQQVDDSMSQSKTEQFQASIRNETARSTAAVNAAPMPQGGNYFPVVNSPEVAELGARMQKKESEKLETVGSAQIEKAKSQLPQFTPEKKLGNNFPYAVVSDKGPEIVRLIREIPQVAPQRQREFLMQIQEFAKRGYPEAMNFIGVVLEYGLLGIPSDKQRALSFYLAAGQRGYQPALYNAANFLFYGKAGSSNPAEAGKLVLRAYGIGRDSSYRVCGLAAFSSLRAGQNDAALQFASGCASSLAKLVSAGLSNKNTFQDRISMLRESIGTGADDGFAFLEYVTEKSTDQKGNLFCKYKLVNKIRFSNRYESLPGEAANCYQKNMSERDRSLSRAKQEADVRDIVNFVQVETKALEGLRASNKVHYSWSVPYLPFGEGEVSLYQSIILKTNK